MKTVDQAAQECWRYAHRTFMDTCDDSQAQAIIAAAMREVCEQERKERIDSWLNGKMCCSGHECGCGGVTRLQYMINEEAGTQISQLFTALDVAEGALKIIAKADDKGWCEDGYADTVAERAIARIAEARK